MGELEKGAKIFCGNFLQDISDHFANYTVFCNMKFPIKPERPHVRISSQKEIMKIYWLFTKFQF